MESLLTPGPSSELLEQCSYLPPFCLGGSPRELITVMALSNMAARCVLPGPAFPLSCWGFFFAPCLPYPPDSCIGKASHHLTQPVKHHMPFASSKPAWLLDSTSGVLASAQNLEICHQAPNPATSFLLKSSPFHLFHPHPTPGFLAS